MVVKDQPLLRCKRGWGVQAIAGVELTQATYANHILNVSSLNSGDPKWCRRGVREPFPIGVGNGRRVGDGYQRAPWDGLSLGGVRRGRYREQRDKYADKNPRLLHGEPPAPNAILLGRRISRDNDSAIRNSAKGL